MFADALVQRSDAAGALQVLAKNGCSLAPEHIGLYKRLARAVFQEGTMDTPPVLLNDLRTMLVRLEGDLRMANKDPATMEGIHRLVLITHYMGMLTTARRLGMRDLAAKIATALCRYTDELPSDRTFYEAGFCCREANNLNMAHVFFNRYLDLSEVIDDPETQGSLESIEFLQTDIPYNAPIPTEHFIADAKMRDEIKDWCIQISMNQQIEQTLARRRCPKCSQAIYEGTLRCPECRMNFDPCIVSGYPIVPAERVECTQCRHPAQKQAWNQWVASQKTCPFCGAMQHQFR